MMKIFRLLTILVSLSAVILFGCSASNPKSESFTEKSGTPEDDYIVEKDSVKAGPIPIKQVSPEYPAAARAWGQEGTVWVKALVGRDGLVYKVVTTQSGGRLFDDASVAAALQWQFTPAQKDGKPVAVWAPIPFKFRINK